MQWLASISVRRPVFATVMILFIVVVGIVGYGKLSVDRFPNVDFPIISVITVLPGAAPEQVETEVSDKIEEAINTLGGIEELRSVSTEGVSQVFVTFTLDKDVNVAAQEVRDHVGTVLPELPEGTKAPVIGKLDPDAAPVLLVAMESTRPVREVTELADRQVRQSLENIAGVGQVNIVGGRKREIQVNVDPVKLRAAGLTATDVQRAIVGQNISAPGGPIDTGPRRLTFRVKGRLGSIDAVNDVIVRNVENHPILIRDIATVVDGEAEEDTAANISGKPAVVLSIRKQSGANSVAVVDALRERLVELTPTLPTGTKFTVIRDNTETTRTSVNAVREHLLLGAVLASLVVLFFLGNVRSTIIAALAIPTSIIGTFLGMWLMGFTLNTITLLALALAVGIVIDDAIVVLENIFRFIDEKKIRPMPAAIYATKEIGLAVLATTLSLLAVFLPVAFMNSIPGRFLRSFGLTMGISIAISLFVSFSLTPMLASRWLRLDPRPAEERTKNWLERFVDMFYRPVERLYLKVLGFSIDHRWVIVLASVAALFAIGPLAKRVPKGFLPKNDEAQFEIVVRTPEGTSLPATNIAAERIARQVREWPEVSATMVTIGDNNTRTPNLAAVFVRLTPPDQRKLSQDQLQNKVRDEIVPTLPKEYRTTVSQVAAFGGGAFSTATVQYTLTGPDLVQLGKYAQQITGKMKTIHGAVDIDSSLVIGNPELVAVVNRRKAADLGISVLDVAAAGQLLIGGVKVSRFEEEGREYDIVVRAQEQYRSSPEALSMLSVASTKLGSVPLLDVAELKHAEGPSKIDRLSRQRQVTFFANTSPGVGSAEVGAELEKQVAAMNLPSDYRFAAFGQSKEIKRTGQNFLIAFGLAFIFMYLILAAQFESWLHPITILLALPLTVPFALISLLIFKQSLDIFTMLGILVLFGVVKKNSILQIDHINHLRREGYNRRDAILHGNRDRLRPILMTTLAFVAGMLPLVTSKGIGAEFNRATAGPVVGGQVLSLLLTLLATPVAYSLFDDLSNWTRKVLRIKTRPDSETGADEIMEETTAVQSVPVVDGHGRRAEVILMNRFMTAVLATTLAGGAGLGSARPAAAAAAENADLVLGLDQALQLARTRNRTLTVEKAKLAQAQTNIQQAWSSLFPTVAAQGKYTHNYKEVALQFGAEQLLLQPSEQLDAAISFTAPILAPAAYPALRAVKSGVRGAEAGFKAAEAGLLLNVAQTFYAASIADEVVLARQSNVGVAKATLGNAQARFDAGTVTKVDLDRAQLALVRAEQGEREARLGQERTYRALATLIQEPRPFKVRFENVVPQKHDERELDLALKLRPEFAALQATAESAESEANANGWRWAPTLSAFGNARKFNYDNFARDRYSWAVGGQLDWLLFDGGTRDAARHQARARAVEAQARAEALRDTIRDDLADGNRALDTKQRGAEAAERSVALAKEALDLVRVQYEAGSVTQVDLLQAQDTLVSAQEALAQAHYDVAAADLFLRHAAGTFPGK